MQLEQIIRDINDMNYRIAATIDYYDRIFEEFRSHSMPYREQQNDSESQSSYTMSPSDSSYSVLLPAVEGYSSTTIPYSAAVMTTDGERHYSGNDKDGISERDRELDVALSDHDDYMQNYSGPLMEYIESKGRGVVDIVGFASATLGDGVLAAIQRTDKEGVLIVNSDYESNLEKFARNHNLSRELSVRFYNDHELFHGAGYNSEEEVFRAQLDHYGIMMSKSEEGSKEHSEWSDLAKAAHARYALEKHNSATTVSSYAN
jgi:hypothetical protein